MHKTFLRMNRSGVTFIAALNGSALSLGAELAWACDLRVMADGDFFIGQPEILLAVMPGGGGTQRLTRLIGAHKALVAILEGKAFTPAEAFANGAVDHVVPAGRGAREGDRTRSVLRIAGQGVGLDDQEVGVLRWLDRMRTYLETTDATGEIPFYNPDAYAQALASGGMPGHSSTDKAVSR